jgi:hypothetical protein
MSARRKAGGKGKLDEKEQAALAALRVVREEENPDAPLWVQPRCRPCVARRTRRCEFVREVVDDLEARGVVAALRRVETQIVTDHLPRGWLSRKFEGYESRAEWLAAHAVVVTTNDGTIHLPAQPTKALRTAYRLLIPVDPETKERVGRLGAFDDDRRQMLNRAKTLVQHRTIPKKLAKQIDHIEKLARLHAGGADANAVAPGLLKHLRRYHGKLANQKYSVGLMTKEEAESRLDAGNLIGLLKWSPLHKSGAAPGTVAGWWARRELQVRSRADRAIGVYEIQDGVWSSAAASIENLASGSDGDGAFTPNMRTLNRDTVVGGGRRHNGATVDTRAAEGGTISVDMRFALDSLDPLERSVLLTWADYQKLSRVSEVLGITEGEAKANLRSARAAMQARLVSYQGSAEE